jgi:hypothetical protein
VGDLETFALGNDGPTCMHKDKPLESQDPGHMRAVKRVRIHQLVRKRAANLHLASLQGLDNDHMSLVLPGRSFRCWHIICHFREEKTKPRARNETKSCSHREETCGQQHFHENSLNHWGMGYGLCDQYLGVRWPTFLYKRDNGGRSFKDLGGL